MCRGSPCKCLCVPKKINHCLCGLGFLSYKNRTSVYPLFKLSSKFPFVNIIYTQPFSSATSSSFLAHKYNILFPLFTLFFVSKVAIIRERGNMMEPSNGRELTKLYEYCMKNQLTKNFSLKKVNVKKKQFFEKFHRTWEKKSEGNFDVFYF